MTSSIELVQDLIARTTSPSETDMNPDMELETLIRRWDGRIRMGTGVFVLEC